MAGKPVHRLHGAKVIEQDFQPTAYTRYITECHQHHRGVQPEAHKRIVLKRPLGQPPFADSPISEEPEARTILGVDDGSSSVSRTAGSGDNCRVHPIRDGGGYRPLRCRRLQREWRRTRRKPCPGLPSTGPATCTSAANNALNAASSWTWWAKPKALLMLFPCSSPPGSAESVKLAFGIWGATTTSSMGTAAPSPTTTARQHHRQNTP